MQRRLYAALSYGLAGAALLLALICALNPLTTVLKVVDLLTVPLISIVLLLAVILLAVRQTRPALVVLCSAAAMALTALPQLLVLQPAAPSGSLTLKVLFANLYIHNKAPQKLLPIIFKEKPDVIATVESSWLSHHRISRGLQNNYPYRFIINDVLVFSRYPLSEGRQDFAPAHFYKVAVQTPQGVVDLNIFHPAEPVPQWQDLQHSQFQAVTSRLKASDLTHTLLVGDFNSNMSGVEMQTLTHVTGLKPLAAIDGTWPSMAPGPFRVTLDNALAGPGLHLSDRRVGPDDGSDHRPILFEARFTGRQPG